MPAAGLALLFAAAGLKLEPHPHSAPQHVRDQESRDPPRVQVHDGRDLTRAQDTARLSRDESSMKTAAAELAKLRAEREALKKREVFILSREESSKKDTIEDMHLIIDRLQGQVKAQEREIGRQTHIISGLQGDLRREGTALLDGHAAPRQSPSDDSLIKGLERDVSTEGTTLLRSSAESEARAAVQRKFGNEVRALAKHAAQLDKFLTENGEGPAEPLARSVATEAEHLDRSLGGKPRTPRAARAQHGGKAPPALPEPAALSAAPIDESIPEVKDDLTPLSDSLPQPLTEDLPPLKDAELSPLSPQALSAPAVPEPPRHRPHMQRLRKIQAERPAVAKVGTEANRTNSAKSLLPVPTSTPSSADAIDGASPAADFPDVSDAPDASVVVADAADVSDLGQSEAIPVEATSNAAASPAEPDMVEPDPGMSDTLDEDSE
jgi:hypothetical protein